MGLNLRRRRTAVAAALVSALRRPIRAIAVDASSVRRPAPRRDLHRAARVLHAVRAVLSFRRINVSITVYDGDPARTCAPPGRTRTQQGELDEPPEDAPPAGTAPDLPHRDPWGWYWTWNAQDPDEDR
ncbi:hypothetical protein ACWCP6_16845 [Streptomyces sp. NPDC002004]